MRGWEWLGIRIRWLQWQSVRIPQHARARGRSLWKSHAFLKLFRELNLRSPRAEFPLCRPARRRRLPLSPRKKGRTWPELTHWKWFTMLTFGALKHWTHVLLPQANSTVSRHRQARRLPRAPPAEGGANEHTYCHYILTGLWSRVARTPWNTIAAPTGSRNIIGLEYCHSDDACMPLDQSAVNCCLWLLHAKFSFGFGALNNAIRSMGSVNVLAR